MKNPLPAKNEPIRVDLLRDQFVVIDRRGGDPVANKKSCAKIRGIFKKMAMSDIDGVAEVRAIRDGCI